MARKFDNIQGAFFETYGNIYKSIFPVIKKYRTFYGAAFLISIYPL